MLVNCALDSNTRERVDARYCCLPVAGPNDLRQSHITFLHIYIIKIIWGVVHTEISQLRYKRERTLTFNI
jgi:hypothetical protein